MATRNIQEPDRYGKYHVRDINSLMRMMIVLMRTMTVATKQQQRY